MSFEDEMPVHGGQLGRLAERFGVRADGLLDFSVNVNPEGPPASAVVALREALNEPTVIAQYPDLEEIQLRRTIAGAAGVDVDAVVVGNGFVPLLDATLLALQIRRCLLPVPAFSEYGSALARRGVVVKPFQLDQASGFRYEAATILDSIEREACDAVLLANPQNPSGVLCEPGVLGELIEAAGKRKVRVLLDEAFIDYLPASSLVGKTSSLDNLVVFRSVTKFYGMAGMRVAYAVAHQAAADRIGRNIAPWAVTTLAGIAVRAALGETEYAARTIQLNANRRAMLATELGQLGLGVYKGAANFLLLKLPSGLGAEVLWERLIREEGIVLRHCRNFAGIEHDHLRCAVRREDDMVRLVAGLRRHL